MSQATASAPCQAKATCRPSGAAQAILARPPVDVPTYRLGRRAKDYYLGLFTEEAVLVSNVLTDTQELEPLKIPTDQPAFGPGSWVMASRQLETGLKINLSPYYSPQANPISQSSYREVVDREMITDGSGTEHQAWVVETSGWYSLESPKVLQLYLKDTPPYYLGTEIFNYDSGERKRFVWLRSTQLMER